MPGWIIFNSIVAVLGTLAGAFLAMGSIISIANMKVPWVGALVMAAFALPLVFAGSGIAVWIGYGKFAPSTLHALVAFPWVYLAAFIGAMLLSFR